ncbi:MAG: MBL fold metallo-hydrolase [Clostridiales bacterium]|nr:MBL fold metallo-hydrolase [Clostridiales bacterium]
MGAPKKEEKGKMRKTGWAAFAVLLLISLTLTLFPRPDGSWPAIFAALDLSPVKNPDRPTVTFLDVGQGDAALIREGERAVLIDGGGDGQALARALRREGVGRLDMLIATHPHADHIGGLSQAAEAFGAASLALSAQPPAAETDRRCYEALLEKAAELELTLLHPDDGTVYQLGGIALEIYVPAPEAGEENDRSLFVRAKVGGGTLLVTGDAGYAAERSLLAAGRELSADILKVGHHGAAGGSGDAFLHAVSPRWAVISVGTDNGYGHPAEETLQRLRSAEAAVCRTDVEGTQRFTATEGGFIREDLEP